MKMTGSKPLPVEAVFSKAINADYWLIKYNIPTNKTLEQLGNDYALYKNFTAYKKRNVYAVNSGKTPFYEVAPLEPDVVLADMVKIFHPELLPNYTPSYYFKMK
jgi:iron complex transport system substrate-binding protein